MCLIPGGKLQALKSLFDVAPVLLEPVVHSSELITMTHLGHPALQSAPRLRSVAIELGAELRKSLESIMTHLHLCFQTVRTHPVIPTEIAIILFVGVPVRKVHAAEIRHILVVRKPLFSIHTSVRAHILVRLVPIVSAH